METSFLVVLAAPFPCYAQLAEATATADPSRLEQDVFERNTPPQATAPVEYRNAVLQNAPQGADQIRIDLKTLQIDGVNTYSAFELDNLYRSKLGTNISLADVYAIASQIAQKYHDDGYVLTQVIVPPQTIESGLVKLQVIEGKIGQVFLEGENTESEAQIIRKYAAILQDGKAINIKALEQQLLLINDLPGVSARSILSPSKTTPGSSDLTLVIERKEFEAQIATDNFGSRYLGNYEGLVLGAVNSLFKNNERISGQIVVAGDKDRANELLFGSASYEQPLGSKGTSVKALASISATEPGYNLDEFDVKGRSHFVEISVNHPFIRSRSLNISMSGAFDFRDVSSSNDLEDTRKDHIRAVRVSGHASFLDTFMGLGINSASLEVSHGIGLFGASSKNDRNLTREFGNPLFFKAELNAQRLQRLTSHLNLLVAAKGQLSADPLLSSEEFGVGGINLGRGYDPSEIVGDNGIAGKLEIQWNTPFNLAALDSYQLYSFFDSGKIWNKDGTSSRDKTQSLSSAGIGLRADILQTTQAGFALAFPLTRQVETHHDKDPRFYFNLSHQF